MTMDFDGVRELTIEELDEVGGAPGPFAILLFVGGSAAAGVIAVAAVGFVDGLIAGANDGV